MWKHGPTLAVLLLTSPALGQVSTEAHVNADMLAEQIGNELGTRLAKHLTNELSAGSRLGIAKFTNPQKTASNFGERVAQGVFQALVSKPGRSYQVIRRSNLRQLFEYQERSGIRLELEVDIDYLITGTYTPQDQERYYVVNLAVTHVDNRTAAAALTCLCHPQACECTTDHDHDYGADADADTPQHKPLPPTSEPSPPAPPPQPSPEARAPVEALSPLGGTAYACGAAATASLIASVVFTALTQHKQSQLDSLDTYSSHYADIQADGERYERLQYTFLGVGAALGLAAGVIAYLSDSSPTTPPEGQAALVGGNLQFRF